MSDITSDLPFTFDVFGVIRRRTWYIVLVGAAVMALAVAGALLWPPTYRASATILIEEPDVPADLVKSTVSDFADERLQMIQQRVMTTQNLIGLIDKLGLYTEEQKTTPKSAIVAKMRTKIDLELVSADASGAKSGKKNQATIAFTLSFDGEEPAMAQRVANELVTLYLSENQRSREEQAAGTAGFLGGEAQRLAEQIKALEVQLSAFKSKHAGALPDDRQTNSQMLDRTESQYLENMRQMQSLQERQAFLESQLTTIDPSLPVSGNGQNSLDPATQLLALQAKYTEMSAKYGANHPDVVNLKRQINALKAGGASVGSDAANAEVAKLEADLAAAQQKYGKSHPDVKRLQKQLAAAKAELSGPAQPTVRAARNPAYVQIQAQLASIRAEMDGAKSEANALQEKIKNLEQRVFQSPEVERDYLNLKRDYDAAVAQYQAVSSKQSEANLARNLESERMGEKLSLIEPPALPTEPVKPNRPLVLLAGVVLAIASGMGSGVLADSIDAKVHGQRQLGNVVGVVPLVVVPKIRTVAERRKRLLRWLAGLFAVLLLAGAAALYLQFAVAPLDVLWVVFLDRLGV